MVAHSCLYVLDGLQNDAVLGIDFLKQYNLQIIWIDSCVVMPCLTANGATCQSTLML